MVLKISSLVSELSSSDLLSGGIAQYASAVLAAGATDGGTAAMHRELERMPTAIPRMDEMRNESRIGSLGTRIKPGHPQAGWLKVLYQARDRQSHSPLTARLRPTPSWPIRPQPSGSAARFA